MSDYEVGDIVYALNKEEMAGVHFRATEMDDGSGWSVPAVVMSQGSAEALLKYFRRRNARVYVGYDQLSTLYFNEQGFKPGAIKFDGPTYFADLVLGLANMREAAGPHGVFLPPESDTEPWTMELVGLTYQPPEINTSDTWNIP